MSTMRRALLVVDVQNGFCENGALAVTGGNQVAFDVKDYILENGSDYDLIVASQDWHAAPPNDNCGHFALTADPDYVLSWPVHCVAGTEGAELHPAIKNVSFDAQVRKGTGTQSYSAFEGVVANGGKYDGTSLLAMLRSEGITQLDVCGLATDHCVKASALDALGTGFKVNVLADLTAGVAPESSKVALTVIQAAGGTIISNNQTTETLQEDQK